MMQRRFLNMHSIRAKMRCLILGTFLVYAVIMVVYSMWVVRLATAQVADLNRNTILLQSQTVDMTFANAEKYLLSLSTMTEELEKIEAGGEDADAYIARLKIVSQFQSARWQYKSIDGFFLFYPETKEFIGGTPSDLSYDTRIAVRNRILDYFTAEQEWKERNWFPMQADGDYYFFRVIRVGKGYLGAWAAADTLLSSIREASMHKMDYVLFLTDGGQALESQADLAGSLEYVGIRDGEPYYKMGGQSYMGVKEQSAGGPFSLMALVSSRNIVSGLVELQNVIVVLLLLLLLLIPLVLQTLHRWMIRPVNALVSAMNAMRSQNYDTEIMEKNPSEEFQLVNDTFNGIVSEIKQLKLDIYEEKLQQQKTRLQYYQLQIKPHFFMNSLNMIYQFAQVKNYELVQQLTMYLSTFYRYGLKSNAPLVPLRDEMTHVENYLKIQQLRYPYNLKVEMRIAAEVMEQQLPPLVLQTFIENAVKYAVSMDEVVEICTEASLTEIDGAKMLRLVISDTGPGFPAHILDALNNGQRLFEGSREHIGIYNVQQRLWMQYQGGSTLSLGARKPHGAEITLLLPAEGE